MKCPYCFNDNSKLMETTKLKDKVRKIHLCFSCGRKFSKWEDRDDRIPERTNNRKQRLRRVFDRVRREREIKK